MRARAKLGADGDLAREPGDGQAFEQGSCPRLRGAWVAAGLQGAGSGAASSGVGSGSRNAVETMQCVWAAGRAERRLRDRPEAVVERRLGGRHGAAIAGGSGGGAKAPGPPAPLAAAEARIVEGHDVDAVLEVVARRVAAQDGARGGREAALARRQTCVGGALLSLQDGGDAVEPSSNTGIAGDGAGVQGEGEGLERLRDGHEGGRLGAAASGAGGGGGRE